MTPPMLSGLRIRLILLVAVAVLPALILVLWLGFEQRHAAADQAQDEAVRLTGLASANQERIIESTHQLLVTLATLPQVRSRSKTELKPLFSRILSENPLYANIGLTDVRGRVLVSAVTLKGEMSLADRPWFRKAAETGAFALGEFQVGRITGRPTLNCAYPVTAADGSIVAVVYAAVDLGWWNEMVAEARLPEGGVMTVLDGNGTVLARHPDGDAWIGKSIQASDMFRKISGRQQGTATLVDPAGVIRLCAFSPLRGVPDRGAYVIVGVSRSAAYAEADKALQRGLLALGVGGLLAFVAAWFGGNIFVLQRVNALVGATRKLSAGDLSTRTGIPHEAGELGLVARGLDDMAASLQERQAQAERAEAALRESEDRFRAFMQHSPAVAWIKDESGRYVYYNQRFEEHFLAAAEPIAGRTDEEWLTRRTARNLSDNDRQVFASNRPMEFTEQIPGAKGQARSWAVFKFPMNDTAGRRFIGAVAFDMTERQLLEEQLRQSQKMDAVGKLAAGVAHDFNNLLTVMQGYSELILQRDAPMPEVKKQVTEIQKAAVSAGRLTRQLLAFTRQEVVQPTVLELNAVVADMHKMLKRLIGADIEFTVVAGEGLGCLRADPGHIEQILLNLVVNARDAMPEGGRLTIETAPAEIKVADSIARPGLHPGPCVLLTVTDTGIGMSAETQARIFEPFFTTKEAGKGTGLGLATVYGIVKNYGGDVQVASKLGKGTTFRIYLPVDETSASKRRKKETPDMPRGRETVLVAENEEALASMVQATLESLGYRVLTAPGGAEALQAAEQHDGPIHLVITDMVMPGMSGPDFIGEFEETRPEVPVIYMSGYAEKAVVHERLMDPSASFLPKPFGPKMLARKVRDILDREKRKAA